MAPGASVIGRVRIGRGSSVWFGSVLRGDLNRIEVGEGTNIQDRCVLHVDREAPCIVKDGVLVGLLVTLETIYIIKKKFFLNYYQ